MNTRSKIFCDCRNEYGVRPNQNICPVCTGLPGSLPILNRDVVDCAIKLGIATNSKISRVTTFERKHYIYPDLPKNFQITQGDRPICTNGEVKFEMPDGGTRSVRLRRIHMEEDAGKTIYRDGMALIDLNRAGTPLLEIVSEPDIHSAEEARFYLQALRTLVVYLGISEANMEEGSFRADINVSLAPASSEELGTKVEIKNVNSFKFVQMALEHEIARQEEILSNGGQIEQQTRLWDEKEKKTVFMRSKERGFDYRYMAEPDIPPVLVDDDWVERIRDEIPELPLDKKERFVSEYGLSGKEAAILTQKPEIADFYEKTVSLFDKPKMVANWILRDLLGYLKERKLTLRETRITPETMAELLEEVDKKIVTQRTAQELLPEIADSGRYPSVIIQEKGLMQISSEESLIPIIEEVEKEFPQQVSEFRGGNEKILRFLIGQVMKKTKGKADPQAVIKLLRKHFSS